MSGSPFRAAGVMPTQSGGSFEDIAEEIAHHTGVDSNTVTAVLMALREMGEKGGAVEVSLHARVSSEAARLVMEVVHAADS